MILKFISQLIARKNGKSKSLPISCLPVRSTYSKTMIVGRCVILYCFSSLRNAPMGEIPQSCGTALCSLVVISHHHITITDNGEELKYIWQLGSYTRKTFPLNFQKRNKVIYDIMTEPEWRPCKVKQVRPRNTSTTLSNMYMENKVTNVIEIKSRNDGYQKLGEMMRQGFS